MKKMVAAALAAMMLLTAGTAMAASFPNFDFSGDIKAHYRWQSYDWANDEDGGKIWFRLNAKSEIDKNTTMYGRLALQKLTGDNIGADFSQGHYDEDQAFALDRFGVIVKGKNFTYNIGRQGTSLGATALLYSSNGYMGKDMGAIDGVTASGKSGVTDLKFVAGRLWDDYSENTYLYGIDASYSPAKNWTLGTTLMQAKADDNYNYWGVNAAYTTGKTTLQGEYAKSNYDVDNKAYAFGATYTADAKNSAYVFYSHAEDSFVATDFDQDGKGMYYGFTRKLSKDTTFDLFYKDMKTISKGENYDSLRTTFTFTF